MWYKYPTVHTLFAAIYMYMVYILSCIYGVALGDDVVPGSVI
jgi:hypothetical protein